MHIKTILTAFLPLAGLAVIASPPAGATAPAHRLIPPAVTFRHVKPGKTGRPEIIVPRDLKGAGRLGGGNLLYSGGPVQQDPRVHVLFWGSWWTSGCSDTQNNGGGDETYLYNLYHGLGTSSDNLSPITSQYGDSAGTHPTFPTLAGQVFIDWAADCTDPPASATDAQLAAEAASYADSLISQGKTIGANDQIVVVSPSGTNPGGGFGSSYCAYHNWTQLTDGTYISWTNLPYIPDQGSNCGADMVQNGYDGWSIVGGHEYAESTTDPLVNLSTAWSDDMGFEIGDKCAWTNLFLQTTSTGTFAMQPEWDNRTSACQPAATYPWGAIKLRQHSTHCADDFGGSLVGSTKVDISSCDGLARQRWVTYPDGSLRRYLNTGVCVNIVGHRTANGALIDLLRCDGQWNQVWVYHSATHEWVNPMSGKCLRDPGYSLVNGKQLQLWACIASYGSEQWTNI